MARKKPKRDDELAGKSKDFDEDLIDIFNGVDKGFKDQNARANDIFDNWDMYNCVLGEQQFYNGDSKIFLPFVRDAVEAIVTRQVNQLFPPTGRYVEVTCDQEDKPQHWMSLLEAYVRKAKLRTQIAPALIRNGQMEGQYSLYVDWAETKRQTVYRVRQKVETAGMENEAAGEVEDLKEEEVVDAAPAVEVIADTDLLVLPVTVDSISEALEVGGSVTVVRRWTKGKIKAMAKAGHIIEDEVEDLIKSIEGSASKGTLKDVEKNNAEAAGMKGRGKHALIYETWARVKVKGFDERRLVRIYFGGDKRILGCKLCPYWNDRCPVISEPAEKIAGVFKGQAPVSAVRTLQILANDTINEGADTAHFTAAPIIMTDPDKNPRIGDMILAIGAVWPTSPADTKIVEFPELWATAIERARAIQQQIFQTLGVTPAMIPQNTGGKAKRNQAEMAIEQQVDLLNTADAVTILEEGVFTPMVQHFAELDAQFREDPLVIRAYGDMGLRATMETVEPLQLGARYEFRWFGVEATRNAAQIQQQIGALNVVQNVPPEKYPGYKLNVAPFIVYLMENAFGPRLGSEIFTKEIAMSVDPQTENMMLEHGLRAPVHMGDDDMQHLQVHAQLLQQMGGVDPHGTLKEHMQLHQQQMQNKVQAMAAQQGPHGPGAPSPHPGAPAGGGGGGPQPGASPGQPHAAKAPPGAIHPDSMGAAGAVTMPRHGHM